MHTVPYFKGRFSLLSSAFLTTLTCYDVEGGVKATPTQKADYKELATPSPYLNPTEVQRDGKPHGTVQYLLSWIA